MKVYIGCDHNGLKLKEKLITYLKNNGIVPVDIGATEYNKDDDYNTFARIMCKKIKENKDSRGILICGTGVGMCIQANRFKGIRAVLGDRRDTVRMARRHNDVNVLALGANSTSPTNAMIRTATFITTRFDGGHYAKRNELLDN
ncbi:MAG: RpiB/LacA/LacB family sugar-phosphate isomerase [Clostridia bacterium]